MATYQKVLSSPFSYTETTDVTIGNQRFRTFGQEISTALDTVGLTKASDSGQVDWATATRPTTTDTLPYYEIRQLSDSLHSTDPVVFKFEFGTASGAQYNFQLKASVSSGTNGSGSLNTPLPISSTNIYGLGQAGSNVLWASRNDTGDFWFLILGGTNYGLISLERMKNQSTGAPVAGNYRIAYWSQSTTFTYANWQKQFSTSRTGGLTEGAQLYWNGQPSPSGDVILAPTYACFPELQLMDSHLFYRSGEIGTNTTFTASVFNPRTYIATGGQITQANAQFAGVWE